ncbi:MAG: hypothetical protein Fur002_04100 [Anaerolineales bacterium]
MAKQMDGVIEAVRSKNGQLTQARVYERRGAAYSDRVLLDRKTLMERLKQGRLFAVGARLEFWGNRFTLGKPVLLVRRGEQEFISTRADADSDDVEGAPLF